MVVGERPKYVLFQGKTEGFYILIFELFDNSLVKFGTKWWAMIHLCLQRPSLWGMQLLLCQNTMPLAITSSPTNCGLFKTI